MDYQNAEKIREEKNNRLRGWIFFGIFLSLVISGICAKRIYGHPDLVVFFHLPAAVFLVLASNALSGNIKKKYRENAERFSRTPNGIDK